MPTQEPELTAPVDLCTPDGRRLQPAARGWSRVPLHTGNVGGPWGRAKRWDYWAVLADDLVVSTTYADVDYLGIADVWWCDLATGATGGRPNTVPLARGIDLPDRPGTAPLRYRSKGIWVDLVDDDRGTDLHVRWTEADGRDAELRVLVALPPGHQSLNVVIPWSEDRFQYTSKHQARPAHGVLRIGDEVRPIGIDPTTGEGTDAWGVLDVGRGRWPYRTTWNWGGGAGRSAEGAVIGLQFGAKWTEGTGATENGVLVDGVLHKIGQELSWTYRWDAPRDPWRVRHPDGSLDLTLETTFDKHSKVEAGVLGMEVHQVFGRWSGHVTAEDGSVHHLDGALGFAEEARNRW
jgi:hypothetical protein